MSSGSAAGAGVDGTIKVTRGVVGVGAGVDGTITTGAVGAPGVPGAMSVDVLGVCVCRGRGGGSVGKLAGVVCEEELADVGSGVLPGAASGELPDEGRVAPMRP